MFESIGVLAGGENLRQKGTLGDGDAVAGVGEEVPDLLGGRAVVDRERSPAEVQRRGIHEVELRPVGQHHRQGVAATDAEGVKAGGNSLDPGGVLGKGDRHPIAGGAQCHLVRSLGRRELERLAQRRRIQSLRAFCLTGRCSGLHLSSTSRFAVFAPLSPLRPGRSLLDEAQPSAERARLDNRYQRYINTIGMTTRDKTPSAPPRRLSRAESKSQTRAKVLEAARRVFEREGYHGATLDRIAAEAGFTKGAVYSTFDSKADVILALIAARAKRRRAAWTEVLGDASAVEDFVAEISRRGAAEIADERDWMAAVSEFLTVVGRSAELRSRYLELHESGLSALTASIRVWMQRTGESWASSPRRLATIVTAMNRGLALEGLVAPEEVPEELIVEAHLTLLRGTRVDREGDAAG